MKFPLTNNPDVDNLIYDFVYYTEEQLINKYREIHKKKFADTLRVIRFAFYINMIPQQLFARFIEISINREYPVYILYNMIPQQTGHNIILFIDNVEVILNFNVEPRHRQWLRFHPQQQQQEEQEQEQEEDCNIKKDSYKSKSKYKNIKNFNYRKKYKNPRKIHKSVGGKCVRFKYV